MHDIIIMLMLVLMTLTLTLKTFEGFKKITFIALVIIPCRRVESPYLGRVVNPHGCVSVSPSPAALPRVVSSVLPSAVAVSLPEFPRL